MTIRRQLSEQTTRELKEVVGLSIGVAEYVPSDDDATSSSLAPTNRCTASSAAKPPRCPPDPRYC